MGEIIWYLIAILVGVVIVSSLIKSFTAESDKEKNIENNSDMNKIPVKEREKVELCDISGKIEKEELCLIAKDGRAYHTYYDCYLYWKTEQKEGFVQEGWEKISIEEAKENGLRKCKFCKERDLTDEEIYKRMISSEENYIVFKAVRTGSALVQDRMQMLESGNLLCVSMDFDTSDYYLYEKRDADVQIGYIPRSVISQLSFDDIPQKAYCFVKEVKEKDNGKFELYCYIDLYNHKVRVC